MIETVVDVRLICSLSELAGLSQLRVRGAILLAAVAWRCHQIRLCASFLVDGYIGGRFLSNFRRVWGGKGVKHHSGLYIFWIVLFNLCSRVRVLALFRLEKDACLCNKSRVIDDGFCELTNGFRWVYDLLSDTLDQRSRGGRRMVSDFFMLDPEGFEHHWRFRAPLKVSSTILDFVSSMWNRMPATASRMRIRSPVEGSNGAMSEARRLFFGNDGVSNSVECNFTVRFQVCR